MLFVIVFIAVALASYALYERYFRRMAYKGWAAETKEHAATIEAYEHLHREWATCLAPHKITLTRNGVSLLPLKPKSDDDWPEYVSEKVN